MLNGVALPLTEFMFVDAEITTLSWKVRTWEWKLANGRRGPVHRRRRLGQLRDPVGSGWSGCCLGLFVTPKCNR